VTTLAHEVTWDIAHAWESYYASAVLSGIVGDTAHQSKGGYHISIENNIPSNYSVTRPDDKAPPGNWPRNLAAAIDMSMSPADMKLCSDRLWWVWNDKGDPRRNYINAFNGWFNDGGPAKRYDFVTGPPGGISETSSDHKWHVHLEIRRKWVPDWTAAAAIKSILRGESKDQYIQNGGGTGAQDMYAKYGMGLNGSPISHPTMYLQEGMQELVNADPGLTARLPEHPLSVDGKYGDQTAYWVSVLLTGGEGKEVNGSWFRKLDKLCEALQSDAAVAKHSATAGHGGLPDEVDLVIPARSVEIPAITVTAQIQ
jgi:hypothetical protein